MRRVVITGMGIVSPLGNNAEEVKQSLYEGKSGIVAAEDYEKLGFRCQVHGAPKIDPLEALGRRTARFMGKGSAWNYMAMEQAIEDAGLNEDQVSNERTGLIMALVVHPPKPSLKLLTSLAKKVHVVLGQPQFRKQ